MQQNFQFVLSIFLYGMTLSMQYFFSVCLSTLVNVFTAMDYPFFIVENILCVKLKDVKVSYTEISYTISISYTEILHHMSIIAVILICLVFFARMLICLVDLARSKISTFVSCYLEYNSA
jgi:hypothetical protein